MTRGLVFGKFMPLHRGHQFVIERALAESDSLTVAVYDSAPAGEYPEMPVEMRAGWIADLYPDVEAVVPLPDPRRVPDDGDDARHAELYAAGLAPLGDFDRVFTSETRYERFARLMAAEHVVVDEARELVPISGTKIREELYEHRAWLDPRVYASLVRKVAIVGTESTGKTTLARELADRMDTLWAPEYGRELWVQQGGAAFADYLTIGRTQLRREEELRRESRRLLFCDTTPWTTLHWCLWMHGTADPRLRDLADRTMGDYTWLVCADDFPWQQDGWREMGNGEARRFQEQQLADLDARGMTYGVLEGPLQQRIDVALRQLGERAEKSVR